MRFDDIEPTVADLAFWFALVIPPKPTRRQRLRDRINRMLHRHAGSKPYVRTYVPKT